MKKEKFILVILLNLTTTMFFSQSPMDKARFQTQIINQWWSCENQLNKNECDMRLLIIKKEGFEFNCINWSKGFSGNKCNYDLKIQSGFFEIAMKTCPDKPKSPFLYGYLTETNSLFLLIRTDQLALSPALLSEKEWLKFEKIVR